MENDILLKLVGITYNQIESGVYALILEDSTEGRRLAIVIGYPEAQSIECRLQHVKTPRPLAHDLMANMLDAMGAKLLRVDIHRLPTGPFAGRLTIENVFGEIREIDARSSDAIALAIRVEAPIYTNRELLEKEGFIPRSQETKTSATVRIKTHSGSKYAKMSIADLEALLASCVAEENYEEASKIKKELTKRQNESGTNSD